MSLSLRIHIVDSNVTKTIAFDPSTTVYDACRIIRDKCTETNLGPPKDYGLFLTDDENKTGVWLEPLRHLEYYILRNSDLLEYRKKIRTLRVKMLDGSVKTMLVDDSQIVANLMVVICTKIGITNHDEYSLVLEEPENQENIDNRNYGTLTLKRKKEERERDVKMEQLRKKLRTDDEVNWLDPSKTLREQGIDENETVLLRRKFFFSDQNIDSRDPVQLNLLYVQARDAILNGTHPITENKACEFAGIQCQIQFGNYNESKHKAGFLDLKEFLPQSYVKVKGIEKKIFSEHKRNADLSELDAKVLYTKNARALKTYGVTFFLVKEKMKGKNKLVPRLLGVTKDSVLRLDEKTKEILKTWPLTTVRRWGASPKTFTLDFGDYSDQYYSVQTTEAEQIQQIIAGYIDIILKKKQAKDHFGIEGDEGSTMVEDSVSPHKATILQHESSKVGKISTESVAKPAVMRAGTDGEKPYGTGHVGGAQYTTVSGQVSLGHAPSMVQQTKITSVLSEPQRALLSTISTTQTKIQDSQFELEAKAQIPELGSDPSAKKWKQVTLDTRKQNVGSQIAAMNAATAQVVTLTSGPADEVDHNAVGAAITTIGSNLPEMTKDVKVIAALMEDQNMGEKLLDATRKLCNAFSDLLKAAEPESKEPRQNLLNAASRVGEASTQVLATIGEDTPENKELQDMLLSLAKAVANTTAALVLKAKNIAATCDDQQTQNKVIGAATQCALATSQLVACAKVVAPTLQSPACQEQLTAAVREVAKAVENLVAVCNDACGNEELLNQLKAAAAEVTRTLNDLLNHIKLAARERAQETVQESSVEAIFSATDKLTAASGDASEMVKQARLLGQATAQLIQSIKGEAEKAPDSDIQRRLLAAAKTLADATARMVEAARQCASHPHEVRYQDTLRKTAEDLRDVTTVAATTPALRAKLVDRVQICARRAISTATQCITASQASRSSNSNAATRAALNEDTKDLAEHIPPLIESIKANTEKPDDTCTQSELMYVAEVFLHPATRFIQSARSVLPTIKDHAVTEQLSSTTQTFSTDISELQSAISRAKPACQGLGLEAASQLIADLQDELNEFERAVDAHKLRPLPGDSLEHGTRQLGSSSKAVNQGVAQLLSAASQGNEIYTAQAAKDTAHNLRTFTGAVRTVAATTNNKDTQKRIINAGQDVMMQSARLVEEAHRSLQSPGGGVSPGLASSAKEVSAALGRTVDCLPGQRDVDLAITNIREWSATIESGHFPYTNKSYGELQQELNNAAASLNEASSDVVVSVRSPEELASSSKEFSDAFHELLSVSMEMAGQTKDTSVRGEMIHSLKNVSTVSSTLLSTAKSVSADPNLPNGKNQLAAAARAVTDSINQLLDVYTSAAPGQNECDNAVRRIQAMRPLLNNPNEPVNDLSYHAALDSVIERSKILGDSLQGITTTAKLSEHEKFVEHVKTFTSGICTLVEAAAQTAYLVGVSDASSVAGRPGLVDQAQFARASQAIHESCATLSSPTSTQQQVLTAATVIAKHTSALCNACRVTSSKTTNPVAKRHFVQSAKDVANSTANLVKEIKALDLDYSEPNRRRCAEATKPLLDAVDNLCMFASSSEFTSIPAKISPQAHKAQEPIIQAGENIIDSSCSVILAAKSLVVMPKDPPTWQQFASNSKNVSDSIKMLVNSIRVGAPGQHECDNAAIILNNHLRDLHATYMDAVSQSLAPRRSSTLQGFSQQVERAAAGLADTVEPLRQAGKYEAENIGHAVNQIVQYIEPFVEGTIGAASNMTNSKQQELLLDQAKSVTESALQFIYATKDCGGNPKAANIHPDIDEYANSTRDTLQELVNNLEAISTQSGIVSGVVDNLTRAMTRVSDHRASLIISDGDTYVDYQTRMVECAKDIARIASEMSTKAGIDPQKLAPLSADLSHKYAQLASDSIGAGATSTNGEIAAQLREAVQSLGGACIDLVQAGGHCQVRKDEQTLREIGECSRSVTEKVSRVLATLQSGSRGTQACINAASTVSGIIGDLDTTIMFATAGNLNPENKHESFADHRENILRTARALVEDTKTLVAGAGASQEQLAAAAQNAVSTIVQLAEVVKFGAASLGSENSDSQVMLINAVKDVASALGDLIHATKGASGKPIHDPAMAHLKESARVMVTNVTSLLKTVKTVEDEHTKGTSALESTIEAIGQEMRILNTSEGCKNVTPEDLVRCTKAITKATAKSVSAGISNKQDDIIAAANLARSSIFDMLLICKSAAYNLAETEELRKRTLEAGRDCAQQYRELLLAMLQGNSADAKQTLPLISRRVAQSVTEIVSVAELLKGSDWVDPEDPTVIAENELLGAAASIDAAAKKLASLRPRKSLQPNPELDESMNFDEMILEAAKSIAAATSTLVKAASAAQRELIDSGKMSRTPLTSSDDGQWSEGLISAARLVAAATHSLVESANALVQGLASEEKLISAAKQVASSTAQLLVACKVKAEYDTEATRRLQQAGTAVIRATDNLVRAAQQAKSSEEERCLILNRRMVGGIAQEIDARSEVLRIEKQLEEARGKLTAIRQAKYKLRGGDTSGEDTDGYVDGVASRYDSDSSQHYSNRYNNQNMSYNDTYSQLESPEKVNSLERNKYNRNPLQQDMNTLDSTVYGGPNSYGQTSGYGSSNYDSYAKNAPSYSSQPSYASIHSTDQYTPYNSKPYEAPQYSTTGPQYSATGPQYSATGPQYSTSTKPFPPMTSNTIPKPFSANTTYEKSYDYGSTNQFAGTDKSKYDNIPSSGSYTKFDTSTNLFDSSATNYQIPADGFKKSEYNTSTYKIPGGTQTDTYKYESYHSASQPIYSSTTEKYYTSTPNAKVPFSPIDKKGFEPFTKNGSDYQSSFSSNVEYISEPPTLKDNDTLEQKMLKKSVTKQIIEKKTVSTTKSTKQESSTKNFRLE